MFNMKTTYFCDPPENDGNYWYWSEDPSLSYCFNDRKDVELTIRMCRDSKKEYRESSYDILEFDLGTLLKEKGII